RRERVLVPNAAPRRHADAIFGPQECPAKRRTSMRAFILIAGFLAGIAPALATGEIESLITEADRARLEDYEATRAEALAQARAGGAPEDVAVLDEIVAREALPMDGFDPL